MNPTPASLLKLLTQTLRQRGYTPADLGDHIKLASGLELRVQFREAVELSDDWFRTATCILATHATLFPKGLAEFQHATGTSVEQSILEGFSLWSQMDLVTLEDALLAKPRYSSFIDYEYVPAPGAAPKMRRFVLGPAARLADTGAPAHHDGHEFCSCCLVTNNLDAMRSLLKHDATLGIRLYAARDQHGELVADCRVNAEEFPEGQSGLIAYARTWPGSGYEYRKQYVVMRTIDWHAPSD